MLPPLSSALMFVRSCLVTICLTFKVAIFFAPARSILTYPCSGLLPWANRQHLRRELPLGHWMCPCQCCKWAWGPFLKGRGVFFSFWVSRSNVSGEKKTPLEKMPSHRLWCTTPLWTGRNTAVLLGCLNKAEQELGSRQQGESIRLRGVPTRDKAPGGLGSPVPHLRVRRSPHPARGGVAPQGVCSCTCVRAEQGECRSPLSLPSVLKYLKLAYQG